MTYARSRAPIEPLRRKHVIRQAFGRTATLLLAAGVLVAACGGGAASPGASAPASSDPGASAPASSSEAGVPGPLDDAVTLHIGVFPNVTHAPGLVATA